MKKLLNFGLSLFFCSAAWGSGNRTFEVHCSPSFPELVGVSQEVLDGCRDAEIVMETGTNKFVSGQCSSGRVFSDPSLFFYDSSKDTLSAHINGSKNDGLAILCSYPKPGPVKCMDQCYKVCTGQTPGEDYDECLASCGESKCTH